MPTPGAHVNSSSNVFASSTSGTYIDKTDAGRRKLQTAALVTITA